MGEPVLHDIVVIGGGPVGATLALAAAQAGYRPLLLEAASHPAADDPRTFALSAGSRLILERVGAWPEAGSATPIRTIHVSHRGSFGRAVLSSAELGLPALGYVVPHAALHDALLRAVSASPRIGLSLGARANAMTHTPEHAEIQLDGGRGSVFAKLAVIADGGSSFAGSFELRIHDYRQSALVANITASEAHRGTAYERFTPQGPLALLPRESGYAVIWTTGPERAEQLMAMSDRAFLDHLQIIFGERAGRFVSVAARATFPLRQRMAQRPAAGRALVIGNAAQALHPVAGQGLNLGLRDAWELAELLRAAPADPGRRELIDTYVRARHGDRAGVAAFTHALVRVFSNDLAPLRWLRGCGLTFLDCVPPAKRAFMRQAMFGHVF